MKAPPWAIVDAGTKSVFRQGFTLTACDEWFELTPEDAERWLREAVVHLRRHPFNDATCVLSGV